MFNNDSTLAAVFARYAERRDVRAAALARKADEVGLTETEAEELALRMEQLYVRFLTERARLLK